jgi:hypothetical protein
MYIYIPINWIKFMRTIFFTHIKDTAVNFTLFCLCCLHQILYKTKTYPKTWKFIMYHSILYSILANQIKSNIPLKSNLLPDSNKLDDLHRIRSYFPPNSHRTNVWRRLISSVITLMQFSLITLIKCVWRYKKISKIC